MSLDYYQKNWNFLSISKFLSEIKLAGTTPQRIRRPDLIYDEQLASIALILIVKRAATAVAVHIIKVQGVSPGVPGLVLIFVRNCSIGFRRSYRFKAEINAHSYSDDASTLIGTAREYGISRILGRM